MYSHPRRYVVIHRNRGFTEKEYQTETAESRSAREGERECRETGGIEKARKRDKQKRFYMGRGGHEEKSCRRKWFILSLWGVAPAKIRIQISENARHGVLL